MGRKLFRAANLVMVLLFGLSVAVQYNDPDPLPWMVIYGLATVLAVAFAIDSARPVWARACLLLALVALAWSAVLLYQSFQSAEELSLKAVFAEVGMINLRVELVRECGGLLIVAVWMLVLRRRFARRAVV